MKWAKGDKKGGNVCVYVYTKKSLRSLWIIIKGLFIKMYFIFKVYNFLETAYVDI